MDQLTEQNIEVHALVLPKFTIYKNWDKEQIEPSGYIGFLEKNEKLGAISKNFKYKKLFESLDRYDSVNIYKSSTLCAPLLNSIRKIARSYFITIENFNIAKNRHTTKMFDSASCILFNNLDTLNKFENRFGYDEKTLIARDGNHLLKIIDQLDEQEIEKFKSYLNLDMQKKLVYCDLGSDSKMQISFISQLLKLPYEQLKRTTFIFDPTSSTLIDKENLVEFLSDKRFDYLLPDSLLTDMQKAMLLKISQNSIILPSSDDYNTLYPSMYTKSHIYLYGVKRDKNYYKNNDIFVDTFENFENSLTFNPDSHNLIGELLNKNQESVTKMFHPDVTLKNYLEILKIL
jgi:hypothetical protein